MKRLLSVVTAATALMQSASAHYIFSNLIVEGNYTDTYEYVRKNTNNNSPLTDVTSTDFRCNTGSQENAASTNTYTIAAGSTVGMGVGFGGSIIHPGPLLVYLSKAPENTTAASYDGSGAWFKIHELGTSVINSTGMFWETTDKANFTWTLPADTPPGDYLMRTEHIALHQAESVGGAQFYMECAQLSVTGGNASASPGPTAEIPGMYSATDPGIEMNIYYPIPQSYDFPGPAVWPAGADANGSSSSTVNAGSATAISASSIAPTATVAMTSSAGGGPIVVSTTTTAVCSPSAFTSLGSESTGLPVITSAASSPAISSGGNEGAAGAQTLYGQCGGQNWSGASSCGVGSCVSQNQYYHQCILTAAGDVTVSSAAAAVTSAAPASVATTMVTSKMPCTAKATSG